MIVVSDTSPISNLIQIGRLDLLHEVFGEVVIPLKVKAEILELESFGIDLNDFLLSDWIRVRTVQNQSKIRELLKTLDEGESEAIVLAQEVSADWILIDERAGTKIAESWGLHPIGVIGMLIKAKELKLITSVIAVIEELRTIAGFWVSDNFLFKIKQDLGE
jgi:predicted nucleic acid-binding protein